MSESDERWMRRALALARQGEGRVSPNPLVGALVVRRGRMVGAGWHQRFGAAHAEVDALRAAGARARGATLYVTLEPCNHTGKTPPCVDAVLAAGVARVVAAMRDPNPHVHGGGLRRLRARGVEVATGILEGEARALNESFLKHATTGLPFVRWKSALTLDGRIATASGHARWISGARARRRGHELRRWSDAVLVGVGTVLADDPRLDVRDGQHPPKRTLRVVVDSSLRTPPGARLVRGAGDGRVLVYTVARGARSRRLAALERRGVRVVVVAADVHGRPRMRAVLADLGRRGVGRLLVEGGGRVAASLLRADLVDRVSLALAPLLLGGDAVPAVAALGVRRLVRAPGVDIAAVERLGDDVWIEATVRRGGD